MNKRLTSAAAVLAALVLIAPYAFALAPNLINIQGVLTDDVGTPLANGSYSVVFSIWSEEVDGEALWIEAHDPVETDGSGVFSVVLGLSTTINPTVFEDITTWLQMKVGTDDPMSPRSQLTAVPYAIRSGGNWSTEGNIETTNSHFLGTTNRQALNIKVNDQRVLRLIPAPDDGNPYDDAPNIIGGHYNNSVSSDIDGATISGGGLLTLNGDLHNEITKNQGTIGGGADNKVHGFAGVVSGGFSNSASGDYSTVAGGKDCLASGDYSFAAGYMATAGHNGSFVWGDNTEATVASTEANQFKIRASGGVEVGGGVDGNLKVMDAARIGEIQLNGANHVIRMENSSGELTIKHDAEASTIKLFPAGSSSETIRLNAVSGAVTAEMLKLTGGSDVAEPFEMTGDVQLDKGMVVIIDENNPGRTTISKTAYDSRVAGIISGAGNVNPGLTLSQAGILDRGQNVALTGRVYCLASAANGAIKPGDMLTTSNVPGHAMKATDRNRAFGAVIGKAMTSLNSGEGLVLVLVGLQ